MKVKFETGNLKKLIGHRGTSVLPSEAQSRKAVEVGVFRFKGSEVRTQPVGAQGPLASISLC